MWSKRSQNVKIFQFSFILHFYPLYISLWFLHANKLYNNEEKHCGFLTFMFTLQLFVYMGSLKLLICIAFLTHCHNSIDIHKLFHVQWVSVPHLMVKKLTASDLLGLLYYDFPYLIIKGIYDMATGNIVIARKYKALKHLNRWGYI